MGRKNDNEKESNTSPKKTETKENTIDSSESRILPLPGATGLLVTREFSDIKFQINSIVTKEKQAFVQSIFKMAEDKKIQNAFLENEIFNKLFLNTLQSRTLAHQETSENSVSEIVQAVGNFSNEVVEGNKGSVPSPYTQILNNIKGDTKKVILTTFSLVGITIFASKLFEISSTMGSAARSIRDFGRELITKAFEYIFLSWA